MKKRRSASTPAIRRWARPSATPASDGPGQAGVRPAVCDDAGFPPHVEKMRRRRPFGWAKTISPAFATPRTENHCPFGGQPGDHRGRTHCFLPFTARAFCRTWCGSWRERCWSGGSSMRKRCKTYRQARDRRLAGPTAPPEGLCLMKVDYRRLDSEIPPRLRPERFLRHSCAKQREERTGISNCTTGLPAHRLLVRPW